VFLYLGSILLTISVAFFSYEYFEKYFLNLKEKFMIVKSGKEATPKPKPVIEGALAKKD
jgi:peptidoglycan/LPS O-acetylase OafA/YrhL